MEQYGTVMPTIQPLPNLPVRSLQSKSNCKASRPSNYYWERLGVLPVPPRVSGQRRYGPEALRRIVTLQLAQQCGFTLHETRQLLHGSSWQALTHKKLHQLDATHAVLSRVANCECVNLKECRQLSSTP